MAHKPENVERNERIIAMRKAGRSYGEIAGSLVLSRGCVSGVLGRAGLCDADSPNSYKQIRPRLKSALKRRVVAASESMKNTDVASYYGVRHTTVSKWRRQCGLSRKNTKLDDAAIAEIRRLVDDGVKKYAIAVQFNIDPSYVSLIAKGARRASA